METTLPKLRSKLTQLAENNASLLLDKDLVDEARDAAVVHMVAYKQRIEMLYKACQVPKIQEGGTCPQSSNGC